MPGSIYSFANGANVYPFSGGTGWNYKNINGVISWYATETAALEIAVRQCGNPVKKG